MKAERAIASRFVKGQGVSKNEHPVQLRNTSASRGALRAISLLRDFSIHVRLDQRQ